MAAITVDHRAMNIINMLPPAVVCQGLFVLLQPQTSHHNINHSHKIQFSKKASNMSDGSPILDLSKNLVLILPHFSSK